jgi:carboxypeptidase C (cathepsin A)
MRKILGLAMLAMILAVGQAASVVGQEPAKEAKPAEGKSAAESAIPKEESSISDHTIRIGGEMVPYTATAATILLKDEKGEPKASVFYVAYTRRDVKDLSQRPISFL